MAKASAAAGYVRGAGAGPGVVNRVTMKYEHRTTKRMRSRAAKRDWAIRDQKES
jgi:hypothetical protein